jgi:hypothetical protein
MWKKHPLVFCVFCFVLFVSVLCLVFPMLPVSLHCPFLVAPSVFSSVYLPWKWEQWEVKRMLLSITVYKEYNLEGFSVDSSSSKQDKSSIGMMIGSLTTTAELHLYDIPFFDSVVDKFQSSYQN